MIHPLPWVGFGSKAASLSCRQDLNDPPTPVPGNCAKLFDLERPHNDHARELISGQTLLAHSFVCPSF